MVSHPTGSTSGGTGMVGSDLAETLRLAQRQIPITAHPHTPFVYTPPSQRQQGPGWIVLWSLAPASSPGKRKKREREKTDPGNVSVLRWPVPLAGTLGSRWGGSPGLARRWRLPCYYLTLLAMGKRRRAPESLQGADQAGHRPAVACPLGTSGRFSGRRLLDADCWTPNAGCLGDWMMGCQRLSSSIIPGAMGALSSRRFWYEFQAVSWSLFCRIPIVNSSTHPSRLRHTQWTGVDDFAIYRPTAPCDSMAFWGAALVLCCKRHGCEHQKEQKKGWAASYGALCKGCLIGRIPTRNSVVWALLNRGHANTKKNFVLPSLARFCAPSSYS